MQILNVIIKVSGDELNLTEKKPLVKPPHSYPIHWDGTL